MPKSNKIEVEESPRIEVGESRFDTSFIVGQLDEIRQKEVAAQLRQATLAQEVARMRWNTAQFAHRLKDGKSKLNFKSHPYQKALYQNDALDLVIYGSTQFGKSEWIVVDLAVSAMCGLNVLMVTSKKEKQLKFVADRVDPCFHNVDMYRIAMEDAAKRHATADSMSFKHFGPGSINFVYANTDDNFTSYDCDKAIIDEHQDCDIDNIRKVNSRMTGSFYRGIARLGHPSTAGTEENGNLDYLYQNSDRRVWKVPCRTCKKPQVLGWWSHVVQEERGKGGIISCRPRDLEYKPNGRFDIRPICEECSRPMDRLSDMGDWEAQNPGARRAGFQLSNIYNATRRLDDMLGEYRAARHSANAMQDFVNKQLGLPYDMDGSKINESMLRSCASGLGTGVEKYRFVSAQHFIWRRDDA
jgi:phage terminase large subunit GpA-like protein